MGSGGITTGEEEAMQVETPRPDEAEEGTPAEEGGGEGGGQEGGDDAGGGEAGDEQAAS